ncbi:MAG: hypothetical protein ABFC84_13400 [Veillonellales bacterium]
MKTIITTLIVFLFISCAKSDDEDQISTINPEVESFLGTRGLDASSPEDIQYISDYKDSLNCTFVWGMKDSAAWVAKYDGSGTELFSFVLAEWAGGKKYSHTNKFSLMKIDGNLIFVRSYATDNPSPKALTWNYNTFMSVLDFTSGAEISRMAMSEEQNDYRLYKHEYGFIAEEWGQNGNIAFNMIGITGSLIWSRPVSQYEKGNGINTYSGLAMISAEKMIYNSEIQEDNLVYHTYKALNFHTNTTLFEIRKNTFPFNVVSSQSSNTSYDLYSASESDARIVLKYNRRQRTKVIDNQTTGSFHYEYSILSMHFCELSSVDGTVLGYGLLE